MLVMPDQLFLAVLTHLLKPPFRRLGAVEGRGPGPGEGRGYR